MKFVNLVSLLLIGIWLSPIYVQETADEPTQDVLPEEESADTLKETVEVIGEPDAPPTLDVVRVEGNSITITGEEIERIPADDIEQVIERLVPGAISTAP